MITSTVLYIIIGIVFVLVAGGAWRLFRKSLAPGLIIALGAGAGFLVYSLATEVVILDRDVEQLHYRQYAIFPTSFTMKNGEDVNVVPNYRLFGKKAIIINNTDIKRRFIIHAYSTSSAEGLGSSQWLQPYTVNNVSSSVDYVYRSAPNSISTSEKGVSYRGEIK